MNRIKIVLRSSITTTVLALAACGGGSSPGAIGGESGGGGVGNGGPSEPIERAACATAKSGSPEFTQCEVENLAKVSEAPNEQVASMEFQQRLRTQSIANFAEFTQRTATDMFWNSTENICATWGENCVGDPFRYPESDPWYGTIGVVTPVNFYDSEGARLNGRVWAPANPDTGKTYPGITITSGSVQAPETLYWWAAQLLVEHGYIVMTFDVRAQGRSDSRASNGDGGSNANSAVFRRNTIDAIEFFFSTPDSPYTHNLEGQPGPMQDMGMAATTDFNPIHALLDRDRFGIAGHSLGATGVSVVQGESEWPGATLSANPVKAMVAWDNLALATNLDGITVTPRVPSMGQSADYFLDPTPYASRPDEEEKNVGFKLWTDSSVPSYQINIRGAAHYEWSLLPSFPASSWEGGKVIDAAGTDIGTGWAQPVAQYYTLAWFDRWLKVEGETGFDTADARLLNDTLFRDRLSYYFLSKRAFPTRAGTMQSCEDIGAGCE